jgi:quercetin dioxygenase-like cupin family protein
MSDTDRLRQHPADRLASPVQMVDLAAAADRLRAEAHAPVAGHRQIALVRDEGLTVILFLFEAGGHLKEHRAEGSVTIQVLEGTLVVGAGGGQHELGQGRMVALAPGTMHAVQAPEPATMLLTVSRPRE